MTAEKIGVCLAGFGNFGKRLYDQISKINRCFVKYLYHPDPVKATSYGPKGNSNLEAIFQDSEILAFVIATPNDQHFPILKRLIDEAKHHIYVEKPLTAYYSEARYISEWRAFHQIIMVGHNQRREGAFRKAKELLNRGAIGRLVNVNFNFSHGAAFALDPTNWRCSAERHREGPLITLGSHAIDTIHYLFGRIKWVQAKISNLTGRMAAPDSSVALMELENSATVFLQSNYNQKASEKLCVISGTEGTIYIRKDQLFIRMKDNPITRAPSPETELPIEKVDSIDEELNEFLDAVDGKKTVETGIREGLAVMAVVDACWRSSQSGLPVRIEY